MNDQAQMTQALFAALGFSRLRCLAAGLDTRRNIWRMRRH